MWYKEEDKEASKPAFLYTDTINGDQQSQVPWHFIARAARHLIRAGLRLNWAWCCRPEKTYFLLGRGDPKRSGRRPSPCLIWCIRRTFFVKFHSCVHIQRAKLYINNDYVLVCSSQFSTKYRLLFCNIRLLIQWQSKNIFLGNGRQSDGRLSYPRLLKIWRSVVSSPSGVPGLGQSQSQTIFERFIRRPNFVILCDFTCVLVHFGS